MEVHGPHAEAKEQTGEPSGNTRVDGQVKDKAVKAVKAVKAKKARKVAKKVTKAKKVEPVKAKGQCIGSRGFVGEEDRICDLDNPLVRCGNPDCSVLLCEGCMYIHGYDEEEKEPVKTITCPEGCCQRFKFL